MHFEIRHTTRFDYGDEVRLDPLTVRLRPRTDVTQRLVRWVLACEPKPVGIAEIVDLDGNDLYVLRFEGRHRSLELVTWSEVETYRTNPFAYVATDMSTLTLPVRYSGPEARSLDVYRASLEPSDEVAELADRIAREVDGLTLQFLPRLTRWIHDNLTAVVRPHGEPWRPSRTLYEGQGACRDFAELFIDACRAVGIAARFVSGYRQPLGGPPAEHLHAWAEVYVPGGGWRGFDPSTGLAAADDYVVVAVSPSHVGAAPTEGRFWHTGVRPTFDYKIEIRDLGAQIPPRPAPASSQ